MRPVGHITDLINDLLRWKKNRAAKAGRGRKPLSTSELDRAIAYLIEYRSLAGIVQEPIEGDGVDSQVLHHLLVARIGLADIRASRAKLDLGMQP